MNFDRKLRSVLLENIRSQEIAVTAEPQMFAVSFEKKYMGYFEAEIKGERLYYKARYGKMKDEGSFEIDGKFEDNVILRLAKAFSLKDAGKVRKALSLKAN